jgi:integrase
MPKKRRGNKEGSVMRRKDGRWMAQMTIGRDPATGKLKRTYFYGKTRQEAADQLAKALSDVSRGSFVAPHKILNRTTRHWYTWLDHGLLSC